MSPMLFRFCLFILYLIWFTPQSALAQDGLEGIIVELYYITDEKDSTDILSGSPLKTGTKTYRIYADLAPEYKLQVVYGEKKSPMKIETTTYFFNNFRGGFGKAEDISRVKIKEHTVPLDSWITIGAVSRNYFGVLKAKDNDGSVIGGVNNDGGSARIEGGLLTNDDPQIGRALTEADGYIAMDAPDLRMFNIDLAPFIKRENDGLFYTDNGAYTVVEGVSGLDDDNEVLIAQITTDGELSFQFNLQLLAPYGGVERFVAQSPDNTGAEFRHPDLVFPKSVAEQ
jgi:hypothetical protein